MRWRKALAGLGVAVAVLSLAEVGARLVGPVSPAPLVVRMPDGSTDTFVRRGDALQPTYQGPFTVDPVPLEASGPRVLVFGGSSMHGGGARRLGVHQEAAGVVARALNVEVRNLAAPGLDSGHLARIVHDSLVLKPDVVVLYTGHNDLGNAVFFHRYGDARAVWTYKLRGSLGRLALFQALEAAMAPREFALPTRESQGRWTVDAAQRDRILEAFDERLRAMIRAAHHAGSEVVVATVASNPWEPSLDWTCPDELADAGLRSQGRSYDTRAVDRAALDLDCVDATWLRGRLDEDVEALDQARDLDPLPLRADRRTVDRIRTIAAEEGAALADVNAALRELGGGVEPSRLYEDSVHYSVEGHAKVGEILAPVVAEALARADAR